MTLKERFLYFLKTNKQSLDPVFEELGISKSNFKGAAKKTGLNSDTVVKIMSKYPNLSADWLLLGVGGMYRDTLNNSHNLDLTEDNYLKVYYDLPATASNISDLGNNELYQDYELYKIPGFEGCKGFPVLGDSMIPTMRPGEIVAIEPNIIEQIANGEIYLIITRDGQRMIKRLVMEGEGEDMSVKCVSDNPDKSLYKDFYIQPDMIYRIYSVRGCLKLDLFT